MRELRIAKSEGRKKNKKNLQVGFLHSSLESSKSITALKTSRCFATSKEEKLEGGGFLGERFKENKGLDKSHFRKRLGCGKQLFMIQVNYESTLQLNSPWRGNLQAEQAYRLPLMLRQQHWLGATMHHARPHRTTLLQSLKAQSCN